MEKDPVGQVRVSGREKRGWGLAFGFGSAKRFAACRSRGTETQGRRRLHIVSPPPLPPPPTRIFLGCQVELFVALCKALPQLGALRSLELDGLKQAFEKVNR